MDNPGNRAARSELVAALLEHAAAGLASGLAMLDVGCGTGWWLEALAEAGARPDALHGLDVDGERVQAAANRVPGAAVRTGNAEALPYPDATFALVTQIVVLSSLPSSEAVVGALCEARRVLAPGGTIAVYEPRVPNPFNRATRLLDDHELDRAGLAPRDGLSLTLAPPLGRRLGRLTPSLHPLLSRIGPLLTHRLVVYRHGGHDT
jgi:ubiquinone/menaquinone biosynthesis C-methylase UbiE